VIAFDTRRSARTVIIAYRQHRALLRARQGRAVRYGVGVGARLYLGPALQDLSAARRNGRIGIRRRKLDSRAKPICRRSWRAVPAIPLGAARDVSRPSVYRIHGTKRSLGDHTGSLFLRLHPPDQ